MGYLHLRKDYIFWGLLSHSYLLICTSRWCKHGTMAISSLELTQISVDGPIRRCLRRGSLQARTGLWVFAPTQGLYFWGLLSHSYLLICTLRWCKHGTMAISSLELTQISVDDPIRRCMERGSLQVHTGLWSFCTYARIIFLGSPFP